MIGNEDETYGVYSGQTGDGMLGEYTAVVRGQISVNAAKWTLIARVDGEVVWIIPGSFTSDSTSPTDDYPFDDDDSLSYTYVDPDDDYFADSAGQGDRLATSSDALVNYFYSSESEPFTVTLSSYSGGLC